MKTVWFLLRKAEYILYFRSRLLVMAVLVATCPHEIIHGCRGMWGGEAGRREVVYGEGRR